MRHVVAAMLVVVGIIHLLAVSGLFGGDRLTALYGIAFTDPNLLILMRHRAVLFALTGTLLIYAAFKPAVQPLAFIAAFVSVVSFLWLVWSVGSYNDQIARVFAVDLVALACLIVAVAAYAYSRRSD